MRPTRNRCQHQGAAPAAARRHDARAQRQRSTLLHDSQLSSIKDLPLAERVARMRQPEVRRAILSEERRTRRIAGELRAALGPHFCDRSDSRLRADARQSMAELARAQGRTPSEVAYDELLKEDGKSLLMLTIGNTRQAASIG